MRKGLVLFLLLNVLIVGLLVNCVFTLITLLFEDCSADAIHSVDIPAPNSQLIDSRPQLIPKIIHQTWQNESIPKQWQEAQQSCLDLHHDYEYKVRSHIRFMSGARKYFQRVLAESTHWCVALDK